MLEYYKNKKRRESAETLRALEILFTVINEIEKDNFENGDLKESKEYTLDKLYEIKINQLSRFEKVEELEEILFELIGENFFLFVPPESKTYKNIKVGAAK